MPAVSTMPPRGVRILETLGSAVPPACTSRYLNDLLRADNRRTFKIAIKSHRLELPLLGKSPRYRGFCGGNPNYRRRPAPCTGTQDRPQKQFSGPGNYHVVGQDGIRTELHFIRNLAGRKMVICREQPASAANHSDAQAARDRLPFSGTADEYGAAYESLPEL